METRRGKWHLSGAAVKHWRLKVRKSLSNSFNKYPGVVSNYILSGMSLQKWWLLNDRTSFSLEAHFKLTFMYNEDDHWPGASPVQRKAERRGAVQLGEARLREDLINDYKYLKCRWQFNEARLSSEIGQGGGTQEDPHKHVEELSCQWWSTGTGCQRGVESPSKQIFKTWLDVDLGDLL